jgi:SpoVK/Ycf46/Vps4 family AAA+-type ATPase
VTCPDDGWRTSRSDSGGSSTILDSMVGARYRLPSLTASTRLSALSSSFEKYQIDLTDNARVKLPILSASAAWVKGSAFQRIARYLKQIAMETGGDSTKVTAQDIELAIASAGKDGATAAGTSTQVSFYAASQTTNVSKGEESEDELFGSVGGNTEAKRSLEDALALDPIKRQMLARFGMSPPTGILLYGPPGCGKTLLAKAVAKLLNSSSSSSSSSSALGGAFISLRSSDIVRAEIGTSEKMVVSAFELARKNAPSVVFIDEFQALFTERSSGGSSKLASTLLQCMDDIKRWRDVDNNAKEGNTLDGSNEESRIVVLGATNMPQAVDNAFLRPGRFDRVVHVALPSALERESILRVHMICMRIRNKGDADNFQKMCHDMANRSAGFSGADLSALCRSAAIRCLMECGEEGEIEERHFKEALDHDVKASSSDALVRQLQKWRP